MNLDKRIIRRSSDPYWKSNRISLKPSAWGRKKKVEKPPSILDEDLKAEIERLSSDSSDDSDSDMDHLWTVINKKNGRLGNLPHLSESRIHLFGDDIRKAIWEYVRDHPNIPTAFKKATDAYQRFKHIFSSKFTSKSDSARTSVPEEFTPY